MTDWNSMALGLGLDIPGQDRDRTLAPLGALEAVFQRAAGTLASGQEMATTFDPAAVERAPDDPALVEPAA